MSRTNPDRSPVSVSTPALRENTGYVTPEEAGTLTEEPGVYLMKDARGTVIYVGKAKNLKKRVSSYFQKSHNADSELKTRLMVGNVAIIDYVRVGSETEALILEANLIKEYRPRYNIQYKDNKFYPFVKVTAREDFPRIVFTRETRKDGARYFGPFTSARAVRSYIDVVQRIFQIRTCVEMPRKECLNYHIKRCTGPCIGKITREEYREQVRLASRLLDGETGDLIRELDQQMREASAARLYEKAQIVKNKIDAIRLFEAGQNVYLPSGINADFIGLASRMGKVNFVAVIVRNGRMVGKRSYTASLQVEEDLSDVLAGFILEYWKNSDRKQSVFFLEPDYEGIVGELAGYFETAGAPGVRVQIAREDKHKALVNIARENAGLHLVQVLSKVERSESLKMLQDTLKLDTLPMRIEGFDVANILGTYPVASMVSFYAGKPDKSNYRHFRIKTRSAPDDFAMIAEAVTRRYRRLRDENAELPDLVLIDGGKGHLNAALEALAGLGVSLNVISLAKKNEEIYNPYDGKPLVLRKNSPALHVLQQVRDESHRFANAFYNRIKGRDLVSSVFDRIGGIGEKRRRALLAKLMDREVLRNLSEEKLRDIGFPKKTAALALAEIRRRFPDKAGGAEKDKT